MALPLPSVTLCPCSPFPEKKCSLNPKHREIAIKGGRAWTKPHHPLHLSHLTGDRNLVLLFGGSQKHSRLVPPLNVLDFHPKTPHLSSMTCLLSGGKLQEVTAHPDVHRNTETQNDLGWKGPWRPPSSKPSTLGGAWG